jgi:HAT1-interacting factor 1
LYGQAAVGGILGTQLGETPAEATARIEEAKKGATDLTGLVKRRKAKPTDAATPEPANGTNGKRKAEDGVEDSDHAKKTKVDDGPAECTEAKQAKVEDAAEE